MRGDRVYSVYGRHRGRAEDTHLGTFQTRAAAEAEVLRLMQRVMDGRNWASRHHDLGFEVREHRVDVDFEIPPRPAPRDRYQVRTTPVDNGPGRWSSTDVEVIRRADGRVVAAYRRNYSMLHTFEPFRQGGRVLALVAPHYTATSVIDLAPGKSSPRRSRRREGSAPSASTCPIGGT